MPSPSPDDWRRAAARSLELSRRRRAVPRTRLLPVPAYLVRGLLYVAAAAIVLYGLIVLAAVIATHYQS